MEETLCAAGVFIRVTALTKYQNFYKGLVTTQKKYSDVLLTVHLMFC